MTAVAKKMSEEQAVNLLRNALLVAGTEMGEGDHWPVINDTIHKVMKDWEELKVERNVTAELKKHYGDILNQMDKDLTLCPADLRPVMEKTLKEMRESYEACFEDIDESSLTVDEANRSTHMKRAEIIIKSLEEGNE